MVKDFVEIKDCTSLDAMIAKLVSIRESLPDSGQAEVKMRGDDVFGRTLSVSFSRPQTDEEAECDARYAEAYRVSRQRELDRLQSELGVVCHTPRARGRRLRVVS
jgi:hypothetical protein